MMIRKLWDNHGERVLPSDGFQHSIPPYPTATAFLTFQRDFSRSMLISGDLGKLEGCRGERGSGIGREIGAVRGYAASV